MKLSGNVQKTIRIDTTLWNRMVQYAEGVEFENENQLIIHLLERGLLERVPEPDLTDAEIVAKKEDLEPAKPLNNEEKNGQETGQFSLDMSKLKLDMGESKDDFI
jgi:hypothetical protein